MVVGNVIFCSTNVMLVTSVVVLAVKILIVIMAPWIYHVRTVLKKIKVVTVDVGLIFVVKIAKKIVIAPMHNLVQGVMHHLISVYLK